MRPLPTRTWLILILLAGLVAPAPRMASHMLAGRHPAEPAVQKRPALRGLNRLGSPAPAACARADAFCVGAPEVLRPDPPVAPACWARPRGLASAAATPAPVALRLRC